MLMTHNFMLPSQLLHLYPQLIILNRVYVPSIPGICITALLSIQTSQKPSFLVQVTLLLLPRYQVHPSMLLVALYHSQTRSTSYIGVTLDSNLKFDQHITALSKSCFFHIRALRHIRSVLTDDTALTIAASLVGSRLDYANSILYGSSKHDIARVQRIQNTLAKVVIGSCPTGHCNSRLQILHWLPIEYRIQYKLAVLTFNARTSTSPYYLSSLINNYHPSRSLRSSNRHLLDVQRSKSVFSSRGFRTGGPQIWSNFPDSVRLSESINVFRTNLKTSLFQSAFSCYSAP